MNFNEWAKQEIKYSNKNQYIFDIAAEAVAEKAWFACKDEVIKIIKNELLISVDMAALLKKINKL